MFDKYLVDHIGNQYDRKNTYVSELIELKEKIKENNDANAKAKLSKLKSSKKSHSYYMKLNEFKLKEKKFKQSLNQKVKEFKQENKGISNKLLVLMKRELIAKEKTAFYSNYRELTWNAVYEDEYSKVELSQLPDIISYYNKTQLELNNAFKEKNELSAQDDIEAKKKLEQVNLEAKKEYQTKILESKLKLKEKVISKQAFENSKTQFKREYKETILLEKFKVPSKKNSELIRIKKIEITKGVKKLEKVLEANLHEVRRMTPIETTSNNAYISIIAIPFPGLGQLLNKQYIKGLLFALVSYYIYALAIPYSLGYGNYQGEGIAGLISLAEGGAKLDKSIIFMIEGIIAMFLLLMGLILMYLVFNDTRKVAKEETKGIRVRSWSETRKSFLEDGFPFIVTSPALLFTIFIVFVPITAAILLSFTGMDPNHQAKFSWVGISNYAIILKGEGVAGSAFWDIFKWTLIWTLGSTTFAIALGFFLAIMVNNERIKGKAIFRAIYLLPWAVPAFISIMFFSMMFGTEGELTKIVTNLFSSDGAKIFVKQDTNLTRLALVMLQGWLGSAYVFLLSTGVLQAIPGDLYEAAQIDGASGWQKLSKITVPIVLFQTAPLLVGQYTFNFNNFSVIYLFNGGGPFNPTKYGNLAGSSDLLISYIYKLTMENQYQALGAAVTLIVSMGLMFFAFIGFKNSKAFKEEQL